MPHREDPVDTIPEEVEITDDEDMPEMEDGESIVDSEYPENDIRMLADALITSNGEVIADVMAGIRDSLDKLNKVLYSKLGK